MEGRRIPIPLPFGVHIGFRYVRYMEGFNKLELSVEPLSKDPSVIYVPSQEKWKLEMPEWAKDRRAEILAHIKDGTKHLDWIWEEY